MDAYVCVDSHISTHAYDAYIQIRKDPMWYPDGLPLLFISAHNTNITCILIQTHIYIYRYTYIMCICIHTHIHTHIHMHIGMSMICTYTHVCI